MLPSCCGRAGRGLSVTAGLEDFHLQRVHEPVAPIKDVVEGARAYAQHVGLPDPHQGIDYHKVRTHAGLLGDLARHYDSLPLDDPAAHRHFDAMRDEVNRQHDFLTNHMGYRVEVTDHDPYHSVHDLREDVARNKRIKVLGTHMTGGHPYFSNEENDRFRAVHDIFGHLATGRDFDAHGEEAAFQAHSRMFTHHALPAMTSETRGQNGSLIANGGFGPQRIAVLPHRLWHPGLAHFGSLDINEYRLNRHLQDRRAEEATGGYHAEMEDYFGRGGNEAIEKPLTFKDWLKHTRQPQLHDMEPEFQENYRGYELGRAHGLKGKIDHEELDREYFRSPHPEHFGAGYEEGLDEGLNKHQTVAVLVSGIDDMPNGMRVVAHVSGNSIDVLHCPFCGSGAVIARSDGTIECGYCTSVFTVQVQPAFSGFPQSVDGQPYQWPGMPDPNSVMAPDAPPGTNVNPMAQDPMAAGAPPLGDGGLLGVGDSSDPAAGGEDADDDSDDDDNPFAKDKDDSGDSSKSKSDKDSGDKSKSDKKPPQKKSSLILKTANGAQLDAAEFEAHLAIKFATNPLVVAQRVRESRARGLL